MGAVEIPMPNPTVPRTTEPANMATAKTASSATLGSVTPGLAYGTAWPAKTPVHRSWSTATCPFTST